ncbi:hypothetical protein HII28_13345 [Planctomonas sp. JC2975]|uniref:hypothetical protein n=1 Tax=Planctomonas sp. JC2975 TaxID=2729626 RepID=UPI00147359AD|nr:hypothetical protein [Planctomonas sp. JC2975]NNC12860.1 hypothetical protein [Planctomonas sp. JC2975]
MASFDRIPLSPDGCAVLKLAGSPVSTPQTVQIEDGSELFLPANSPFLVLRGLHGDTFDEVYDAARSTANHGLDLLHSNHGSAALLDQNDSAAVVKWTSDNGVTARIVSYARPKIAGNAHIEVRNADGTLPPEPKPPTLDSHPSMRYYRIAEATSDLFDSFRNTYLAIESILSSMVPSRASESLPERESAWLKRALQEAATIVDLTQYAPPSDKSPANAIFDEMYAQFRTSIFHAKADRDVLTPQNDHDRERIAEARARYAYMYRALAFQHLGSRYASASLSEYGARLMLDVLDRGDFFVSNDPTLMADEPDGQWQLAPAGGQHYVFPASATVDRSHPHRSIAVASADAVEALAHVGEIRRFGTLSNGIVAMVEELSGPMTLEGVDRLEVSFAIDMRGAGAPRLDFSS